MAYVRPHGTVVSVQGHASKAAVRLVASAAGRVPGKCSRNGKARQCNAAERRTRIAAELMVFWLRVRRGGGALGCRCCTRLCVSAPFAHGNLVLRAAPQTQEVAWASGPLPEHQTAGCVPAA